MSRRFYRLQMREAEKEGKRIAEEVLNQNRITAHLEYAGKGFLDLKYGDLVLIHKGSYAIALVEIIERLPETQEPSFGIDYSIKVISHFSEALNRFPQLQKLNGSVPHSGTFYPINDSGTNTFQSLNLWYNLIMEEQHLPQMQDLLEFKKQIILQGPPGTGKTREAKKLAQKIVGVSPIGNLTSDQFIGLFQVGQEFKTVEGKSFSVLEISASKTLKVQVSTGKTRIISQNLVENASMQSSYGGRSYEKAIADYVLDKLKQNGYQYSTDRIELVQFHPSYTYEDFVRGIETRTNQQNQVEYVVRNKILCEMAAKAMHARDIHNRNLAQAYKEYLEDKLAKAKETGDHYYFGSAQDVRLKDIYQRNHEKEENNDEVGFLRFEVQKLENGSWYMPTWIPMGEHFNDESSQRYGLPQERGYTAVLNDFLAFAKKPPAYVLIIDEINRANLPSVLGELIYALEYRDEPVQSMYSIGENDSRDITLPENLYIIGTMNTADRSVGHIDYAIQRRFAFVEMLPREIAEGELEDNHEFQIEEFREVKTLFINEKGGASEHLSAEFNERPQDVWLGHSYFIDKKDVDFRLRLKYEVTPILEEYVKDGILKNNEEVKRIIEKYKG